MGENQLKPCSLSCGCVAAAVLLPELPLFLLLLVGSLASKTVSLSRSLSVWHLYVATKEDLANNCQAWSIINSNQTSESRHQLGMRTQVPEFKHLSQLLFHDERRTFLHCRFLQCNTSESILHSHFSVKIPASIQAAAQPSIITHCLHNRSTKIGNLLSLYSTLDCSSLLVHHHPILI